MIDIKGFFRGRALAVGAGSSADSRELHLAACALLLEIAHADSRFTPEEHDHIGNAIRRRYGLDRQEAVELMRLAERRRTDTADITEFTRLIRESYSMARRMVLAEIMWGLVYSDGNLAPREDHLMERINTLLDLEPGYLAAARRRLEDSGDLEALNRWS